VEGATEHFQKAVQLKPDSAEANYSLGIAYMKSERYGQAYTLFQTALKLNPAHPQARVMLKDLEAFLEE
jgi:Flp pilus assembly protein TadD